MQDCASLIKIWHSQNHHWSYPKKKKLTRKIKTSQSNLDFKKGYI